MIRYMCDIDGCDSSVDVRQSRLPPGWSCDPIHDSKGVYTKEMAYVCPDCMAARRGRFEKEWAEKLATTSKPKDAPARTRKKRAKPKQDDKQQGQETLF